MFVNDDGYSRRELWSDEGWQMLQDEHRSAPTLWRDWDFNVPNQPVVGVSCWETEAFCKWAGVRLPKADEAEAAARGPDGLTYPWGGDWEVGICNSFEAELGRPSAVGIFPRDRSVFGVMDMAGNVLEWCADGDAGGRVRRGGSWGSDAWGCRAANRSRGEPRVRRDDLGFRVLRSSASPARSSASKQLTGAGSRSLERRSSGPDAQRSGARDRSYRSGRRSVAGGGSGQAQQNSEQKITTLPAARRGSPDSPRPCVRGQAPRWVRPWPSTPPMWR